MDRVLAILYFVACFLIVVTSFPDGAVAVLVLTFGVITVNLIIRNYSENADFLLKVFMIGLLLRVSLGTIIHVFGLHDFFGPDALIYDKLANLIVDVWSGNIDLKNLDQSVRASVAVGEVGWGMKYSVALLYSVTGRNILAAQFCCAVIGAAIAPMTYQCAHQIFNNVNVAKKSAWLVAVFPAFVVWTGQLLKDGLVIFLLVTIMFSVMILLEKFSLKFIGLLIFCLFGLLTLRFYIAYITAIAIMGSFLVGRSNSIQSIISRTAAILIITLGLAYLGVFKSAEGDMKGYANLSKFQKSRQYLSTDSNSGYIGESNVSTFEGAISFLPIGFTYLIFAPFPWDVRNIRQLTTVPEALLWWALLPLVLSGILYTLKKRLRQATGILIFTLLLTIIYSLFQGNVGTAYRQRCQIQVFLFIFISVALTIQEEKREIRKLLTTAENQRIRQKSELTPQKLT
jgi:hypothetical protein